MKVVVADSAGFCFGVKRAVDSVYTQLEKEHDTIYTFGPIIHNQQVVGELKERGVVVIDDIDSLPKDGKGTIIIRSHGVSKSDLERIEATGLNVVDSTCPFVKKICNIVNEEGEKGHCVIIIGNPNHPEVLGIKGWASGPVFVVENEEDIDNIPFGKEDKITLVSQTTFNINKFKYLIEKIREKKYDIRVVNTICNATHVRQVEAKKISSEVAAMLVIGDPHSSNTQKLYDICRNECKNTYYIQTVDDLDLCELESFKSIGITAGASTPKNIIEEVHTECQKK